MSNPGFGIDEFHDPGAVISLNGRTLTQGCFERFAIDKTVCSQLAAQ